VADAVSVEPEAGRADRRAFLGLPYRLYAGHPRWVPPLRRDEARLMDPRRNPFFRHGEARHFLARRGDRVVGRIAAVENRLHNEVHGDRVGFFGFFDVEPDAEAAAALVDAASRWCAARGLSPMRGPVCYSTNDVCGVLVEGFDLPPSILMPYNRPDYDALLVGAGLVPAKDLLAYELATALGAPERFRRVVERRMERGGYRLRTFDLRDFDREVERVRDVYNRSWERNWGFVPATEEEFAAAAGDMRRVLEPRCSALALHGDEPVGFSLVVRDVNQALRGLDGRLFPLGVFRLLRNLRRIDHLRIVALGLVPRARGAGVVEAFFLRAFDGAREGGYVGGEAGWVLEDNAAMRAPLEAAGARVTKRYRLYETSPAERRSERRR
jgi:hypothetical protein